MNRLTERIMDNVYYLKGKYPPATLCAEMETWEVRECMAKLAAYEDVGLQPHHIDSIIGQLLGYLDAEQAELLIELPCMIGDTVYQINYDRTIENYKVIGFEIDERGQLYVRVLIERPAATIKLSYRKEDLYFSREEAEKALEDK